VSLQCTQTRFILKFVVFHDITNIK